MGEDAWLFFNISALVCRTIGAMLVVTSHNERPDGLWVKNMLGKWLVQTIFHIQQREAKWWTNRAWRCITESNGWFMVRTSPIIVTFWGQLKIIKILLCVHVKIRSQPLGDTRSQNIKYGKLSILFIFNPTAVSFVFLFLATCQTQHVWHSGRKLY